DLDRPGSLLAGHGDRLSRRTDGNQAFRSVLQLIPDQPAIRLFVERSASKRGGQSDDAALEGFHGGREDRIFTIFCESDCAFPLKSSPRTRSASVSRRRMTRNRPLSTSTSAGRGREL